MHDLVQRILAEARAAWRYRWSALLVAWLVALGGALLVFSLPNVYESSARVYADTDSMMSPLLRGLAVQPNVGQQVQLIANTLLSRPNLEMVAHQTGLSLRALTPEAKDELLLNLRHQIQIIGGRPEHLYTITYQDRDKVMAQKVVQALLQILMNDTLGTNIQNTQSAQSFLQQQVQDYSKRLNTAEKNLADFEKANVGFIPSQGGNDYFTRLQNAESKLQTLQNEIDTAEATRTTAEQQMGAMESNTSSAGINPRVQQIDQQIVVYQQKLNDLLLRYTNEYPDVVALRSMIAQLQAQRETIQKQPVTTSNVGIASDNPVYQDMQKSLYAARVRIGMLKTQIALQRKQINDLKNKVDRITDVQTTLQQLTRNYDVTLKKYNELYARLDTANMSQDASHSGNDLKFRVIDPPVVPQIPVSPKRGLLLALVLVMSLAAGGGFAFFLHQIRPVYNNLKSLREITGYPVLGAFSMIWSSAQLRFRRREIIGFCATLCLLLLVFSMGLFFENHITNLVQHFFVMSTT